MNRLMTTDGYHLTMGFLIGEEEALRKETHILYARSGGPIVVPNLAQIVENYIQLNITQADVEEADEFWLSQGVPFNKQAATKIASLSTMPISIRGIREGEVVLPGEPIAVIEAPAFLAAVPEPIFIGEVMISAQIATRFTKIAKALQWQRQRVFEVGMRSDRLDSHIDKVQILADVGLMMSSSGAAAQAAGIRAGGSMGHRYTQRFNSDYEAYNQAVDRMLAFKYSRNIKDKVKLSFLLDTRNTLEFGLPDALRVINERYKEIKNNIDLSVRLDSGDLTTQLKVIIKTFQARFDINDFMPTIIVESGLTAQDIAGFESIAQELNFPVEKMTYGAGGYLIGGISRDFVSMVYKISTYDDGIPTMKFSDEKGQAKESYPGNITLMERKSKTGIKRQIALLTEVEELQTQGWSDLFTTICQDGKMLTKPETKAERIARIEARWDSVAQAYIGDEKRPAQFALRPDYSDGVKAVVSSIRAKQLYS